MNKYIIEKPLGILFHHFHNEGQRPTGNGSLTEKQLLSIIKFIGRDNIINAKNWMNFAINNHFNKPKVCFTFDDAINSQIRVALPVLEKEGIKAFWFVQSGQYLGKKIYFEIYRYFYNKYFKNFYSFYKLFKETINNSEYSKLIEYKLRGFDSKNYLIEYDFYSVIEKEYRFIRDEILNERQFNIVMEKVISICGVNTNDIAADLWMKEKDIINLAKTDHVIGLHSFSHPLDLKSLNYYQQSEEYHKNYSHLKGIIGEKLISMAHPSNSYNKDTLSLLKSMNIQLGFRDNPKTGFYSNLEYPRIDSTQILEKIH